MNSDQIAQEIRDLNDLTDRQHVQLDHLATLVLNLTERGVPAAVADVSHRVTGIMELVVDLAGTTQKLAVQIHSMNDRLTVLERVIDAELPPVANDNSADPD